MIKLLRFMKPYRWLFVLVALLAAAQVLGNLYLPNLFADIVNNGIVKGDTGYIWWVGGLMLLVTMGGTLAVVVGIFYSSRVETGFGKIVRAQLFTHVEQLSLHEFDALRADEQRGYVEFQDVTFSYPGAEEPTLCDVPFTARPGEVTVIIGCSDNSTNKHATKHFHATTHPIIQSFQPEENWVGVILTRSGWTLLTRSGCYAHE